MKDNSGLLSKSIGGFGLKIGQAGLALVTSLVLTRSFGVETFAVFSYAIAMSTLAAVFTGFGGQFYLTFAIGRAIGSGTEETIPSRVAVCQAWSVLLSILVGIGFFLTGAAFPDWAMSGALQAAAPLLGLTALLQINAGVLEAFGRVILSQSFEALLRPLIFLCIALALVFSLDRGAVSYWLLLTLYICVQIALVVVSGFLGLRLIRAASGQARIVWSSAWRTISEARPFVMASAMIQLYLQAGIVAAGLFLATSDVALMRVATQIAAVTAFALQALQATLRPRIAADYRHPDRHPALQRQITLSARLFFALQAPIIVVVLMYPGWLLGWFGPVYAETTMPLVLLVLGQSFSMAMGANGVMLNMTGHAYVNARWSFAAVVLVCIMLALLIPAFGVVGAAAAVAISQIVWNIGLLVEGARRTGLHSSIFGRIAFLERPRPNKT